MQTKHFIFCVHAHQPVGNFDSVLREAYQKCYLPFLDAVQRNPYMPVCMHLSGSLIDWIEKNEPVFLTRTNALVKKGQIEILGGAYYEPIFGSIPERDLSGQIQMMHDKLGKLFGVRPKGAWLSERVWDPQLIQPLVRAGIEYTVLDEFHLLKSGRAFKNAHHQTVSGSHKLDLFFTSQSLRYGIPFKTVDSIAENVKSSDQNLFVYADDCEKFGLWPGTHEWVHSQQWLDQFFSILNKESFKLSTFNNYRLANQPTEKTRVSASSYAEMNDWSGGHFDNFFKKYPESQYMKQRASSLSHSLSKVIAVNGNAKHVKNAKQALYRAQCNCSYWHGVFGGVYAHHLRSSVFQNLIEAERILQKTQKPSPNAVGCESIPDENKKYWRLSAKKWAAFFDAEYGGALQELDYLPQPLNLMANIQRHHESYHSLVLAQPNGHANGAISSIHEILGVKQQGLGDHLHFDRARRISFLDHLFVKPISVEEFHANSYLEKGDFLDTPYKVGHRKNTLTFSRLGRFNKRQGVAISKTFSVGKDGRLRAGYRLENKSPQPMDFTFAVEFNFSVYDPSLIQTAFVKSASSIKLHDEWSGLDLRLELDAAADCLISGVETVSGSEWGLQKTFQETGLLLQRQLQLAPRQTAKWMIGFSVTENTHDHTKKN